MIAEPEMAFLVAAFILRRVRVLVGGCGSGSGSGNGGRSGNSGGGSGSGSGIGRGVAGSVRRGGRLGGGGHVLHLVIQLRICIEPEGGMGEQNGERGRGMGEEGDGG